MFDLMSCCEGLDQSEAEEHQQLHFRSLFSKQTIVQLEQHKMYKKMDDIEKKMH